MADEKQIPTHGVEMAPYTPANTAQAQDNTMEVEKQDISHVESALPQDEDLEKEDIDYARVDKEVQEYALRGQIDVDDTTSKRLRCMIDRRVLIIMIFTYFLQALDKGTMSFSSIMGLRTQLHLQDQQVNNSLYDCGPS